MTKESDDFRQAAEQLLSQFAAEIRDGVGLIRAAGSEEIAAMHRAGEETERMIRAMPGQLKAEMIALRDGLVDLAKVTVQLKNEVEALQHERQQVFAPPIRKRRIFCG
jgi:(p)ppGpp synthase/HD superfamily hydrolase